MPWPHKTDRYKWRTPLPKEIADKYRQYHFVHGISISRATLVIILLFDLASYFGLTSAEPGWRPVVFLALLGLSFHRLAYKIWQPIAAASVLCVACDWWAHVLSDLPKIENLKLQAAQNTYVGIAIASGLCLIITAMFFNFRLRIGWAAGCVGLFLAYIVLTRDAVPSSYKSTLQYGVAENLVLFVLLAGVAAYVFEQVRRENFWRGEMLTAEHERSERLLLNILPMPIAERLKTSSQTIADSFPEVTVMFADIVGFTPLSARYSPEVMVSMLNRMFSKFDQLAAGLGLEKIKTIGDAYMVVGGVPADLPDHAGAMMKLALLMQREMAVFSREFKESLQLRIGISTGPIVAGVIGEKKFIYDLWGDTVNMASRMESHGVPGGVQVTERAHELLRDRWSFVESRLNVKGRGEMTVFRHTEVVTSTRLGAIAN